MDGKKIAASSRKQRWNSFENIIFVITRGVILFVKTLRYKRWSNITILLNDMYICLPRVLYNRGYSNTEVFHEIMVMKAETPADLSK